MVNCRGCNSQLSLTLLNLGHSPIANNLLRTPINDNQNKYFPLHAMTCENCSLVQLSESLSREDLFNPDYVYYSSTSTSWLKHSKQYAQKMTSMLTLNHKDLVLEVASNDGYLLQFFQEIGISVIGIEPASGVAQSAIEKGIPTIIDFFGTSLAWGLSSSQKPKLIVGNNVLAHVPNLHDFLAGISILISDEGVITFEFPHLLNLLKYTQFDTIYHEHYSYLSITALIPLLRQHNLKIFDVERLSSHGGSIRIFLAKQDSKWKVSQNVQKVLNQEAQFDPRNEKIYKPLQTKVNKIKSDLLKELNKNKENGMRIAAYGAAAKGTTLLNYCGIKSDIIEYVVDLNPNKQGRFIPGSLIPIVEPKMLNSERPDILLVIPWNLSKEIKMQVSDQIQLGSRLIRAIPEVEYF
jgi:2-polyprenyl-3-methyl-5-hydroxy-6-metoxy-1,4-benzoquinol methylase